ncbi:MAG: peptidoglycan-binding protein [Clostridia bacterium]|nr:peptidoglycan-binding protein [Clostridia bacterium]
MTGRCELKNGVRADGAAMLPGDPVFKRRTENGKVNRHHIGYFVGGDTVIEAKGTQSGVVTSKLSSWHETAHWLNVEYEGGKVFVDYPTLKRGSTGEAVRRLQELLNEKGITAEPLVVDGKFGAKTENAVVLFQAANDLTPDGVCGQATWTALTGETPPAVDTVTIIRDELAQQRRKLEEVTAWINARLEV